MADSYNELFGLGTHSEDASLEGWWKLQDNAASTTVVDSSSNSRNGVAARNTSLVSTTGPGGPFPNSLDFDGVSDFISANAAVVTDAPLTLLARFSPDSVAALNVLSHVGDSGDNYRSALWHRGDQTGDYIHAITTAPAPTVQGVSTVGATIGGSWYTAAAVFASDSSRAAFLDGGSKGTDTTTKDLGAGSVNVFRIGCNNHNGLGNGLFYDGKIADASIWSRALTDTEVAQWDAGPEPLNTVAPALSGTAQEGETLSATTGAWDSQSNGTITYGYQWTRSDDNSGTNEADISGATSATYTLVSADVGKNVRCRVRGTNDGGFDSAEDTNTGFSATVVASGGGGSDVLPQGIQEIQCGVIHSRAMHTIEQGFVA